MKLNKVLVSTLVCGGLLVGGVPAQASEVSSSSQIQSSISNEIGSPTPQSDLNKAVNVTSKSSSSEDGVDAPTPQSDLNKAVNVVQVKPGMTPDEPGAIVSSKQSSSVASSVSQSKQTPKAVSKSSSVHVQPQIKKISVTPVSKTTSVATPSSSKQQSSVVSSTKQVTNTLPKTGEISHNLAYIGTGLVGLALGMALAFKKIKD